MGATVEQPKLFDTKEFIEEALVEFYRADGNLVCQNCQKQYWNHDFEPDLVSFDDQPYLRRLCNGDLVKL